MGGSLLNKADQREEQSTEEWASAEERVLCLEELREVVVKMHKEQ